MLQQHPSNSIINAEGCTVTFYCHDGISILKIAITPNFTL